MKTLLELRSDARVTLRRGGEPDSDGRCVVYWMQRAQRALDNPGLDVAVEAANILRKPVVAFLGVVPFYPHANLRHYAFLAQGIPDIAEGLAHRGVGFVLRPWPDHHLLKFCADVRPCLVVGDENPLREPERWRQVVADRLRVPLWTVDADVIVPAKLLAKEQYAARTIRPRIHSHLGEVLTPLANTRAHVKWRQPRGLRSVAPDFDFLRRFPIERSIGSVSSSRGGTREALRRLKHFLRERLKGYAARRNHPELDGTSQLSPYLHFGHLGPHTVALAVQKADAPREDRQAFLEELIVRRELAVNLVRFNPRYDCLQSCEPWALETLRRHVRDEREYVYTERQLESAETHDPLWNAAQRQMVSVGWMHGYMRMYWAKKILEWTRSPEAAFQIAVRLNDRYELDGRDPNGYAGIAWAIGGKHDRAWGPERPIFGKIRYMSYASTSRKFDSYAYREAVKDRIPKKW
jgi:deoxyribodipyrimidine photo-lyase